ncbi:hypothetical protein C5167_006440 [Papaver somniferum]|uniref:Pectate lyase superfamily protein domain-containing protein n=1 Tax=Papaver somniferum TaxID=3469 RepID=A0A4Y7JHK1_PAPSO|nr:hypothetical protein C5167_006440 [Papaver somniferum]
MQHTEIRLEKMYTSISIITKKITYSLMDHVFCFIGDGVTENTKAFEKAIMEISKLWKKGGGQLNVPPGDWLTAPFNLTSHMTLFLAEGATILGIQNEELWPLTPPLPSYGVGREHAGPRYGSLIHGQHLKDVVCHGGRSTNKSFSATRGDYLCRYLWSNDIHISNITLHSCDNVVTEDCYISVGDHDIAIKSGWDQYGISYGRPSTNILIRNLVVRSTVSAGVSIGSEMSGGVSNVTVENVVVWSSRRAMRIKTAAGRGGYIQNITYQNITLDDVRAGFVVKINYNQHPDAGYDPKAYPVLSNIRFINIHGQGVGRVIGSIFPAPCENLDLHDEQGNLIKRSAQNVTNIDYEY